MKALSVITLVLVISSSSTFDYSRMILLCHDFTGTSVDINNILHLSERTGRFSKALELVYRNGLVEWSLPQFIYMEGIDMSYYHILNTSSVQDFILAMKTLRAEFYIDVVPSMLQSVKVCGKPYFNNSLRYGQPSRTDENDDCTSLKTYVPYADSIIKIRFSQKWGDRFKIHEYYQDYVIESNVDAPNITTLSRLVYENYLNTPENSTQLKVILYECPLFDVDQYIELSSANSHWNNNTRYNRHDSYVKLSNLCQCINEPGIYHIIHRHSITNQTQIIRNMKLYRVQYPYNPIVSAIFVAYEAQFNLSISNSYEYFTFLEPKFDEINSIFGPSFLEITHDSKFTISMKDYGAQQPCYFTIKRLYGGLEIINVGYHEKVHLIQNNLGVFVNITSYIVPDSYYSYNNYFLANATCGISSRSLYLNIFDVSDKPRLIIKKRIVRCVGYP